MRNLTEQRQHRVVRKLRNTNSVDILTETSLILCDWMWWIHERDTLCGGNMWSVSSCSRSDAWPEIGRWAMVGTANAVMIHNGPVITRSFFSHKTENMYTIAHQRGVSFMSYPLQRCICNAVCYIGPCYNESRLHHHVNFTTQPLSIHLPLGENGS